MGSGASKAQRVTRKYPSPSNIPHQPVHPPSQAINPSILPTQSPRAAEGSAKAEGASSWKAPPLGSLDPKLAARLQELGPVTVSKYEPKIPAKVLSLS